MLVPLVCLYLAPAGANEPETAAPAAVAPPSLPTLSATHLPGIDTNATSSTPQYIVIQPSDEVTYASETTASIAAIHVREGSTFARGEVLLQMDCRVQQADLDKAISQQQLADTALASAKKLATYDSISNFELAQAKAQGESTHADVKKLQAVVEKCTITAPFKGSVATLMVHPLETVRPGDPLIKIVSTDNLDIAARIPSGWLRWIHNGTCFTVKINEIHKVIPVHVVRINPEIDSVSQTIKITAKTLQPEPSLLPGMSGQANFMDNPCKNSADGNRKK